MARQGGKELGVNRVAVLVYGGGAILLAPWIVVPALSRKQEYRRLPPPAVVTGNVSIHSGRARPDGDHVSSAVSRRGRADLIGGDVPLHLRLVNTITVKHAPLAIALAYDVFVKPKLLGGGMSPKALTWAFASSVAKSSGYMLTSANVIMVSGHGHGFSVQKNHALISVPAGQGRNIYAELQ